MRKAIILSNIYFFASFIYTIIAFYALSLNKKKALNKIFFLLCVSLSMWSVIFSLMIVAKNQHLSLLFNKIAILAWGCFYSLIFHFFYILSNPEKKLSKKFYILVYSPGIIGILLYLLPLYPKEYFYMMLSDYGYVSVDKRALPVLFYNIYGCGFTFLSLVNIYLWHRKSKNQKNKTTKKLIFYTYIVTIFIIVYINFKHNTFLEYKGLRFISLLIAVPIFNTLLVLLKERTMHKEKTNEPKEIINFKNIEGLLKISGYIYISLSFLNLLFNYKFPPDKSVNQIILTLIIFLLGGFHFFIDNILKNRQNLFRFITITSIIMMSLLTFKYTHIAITTIWSIFFYYMITTMIFDKRRYSYAIGLSAIVIQLLALFYIGEKDITINSSHYIGRIVIILISFIIGFYINKVYRSKINETTRKATMQLTLNNISKQIIEMNEGNKKDTIIDVLTNLSKNFNCNKAYVYTIENSASLLLSYCKNCNPNSGDISEIKTILTEGIVSEDELLTEKKICIPDIETLDLSPAAIAYFRSSNSNSFYTMPIMVDEKIKSVMIFEYHYDESIVKDLNEYNPIITNLSAIVIKKLEREHRLYFNDHFDNITKLKNKSTLAKEVTYRLENNLDSKSALICLDVDNFKEINDAFGYNFGDTLLQHIANKLTEFTNNKYSIARFGADEFLLYFNDCYDEHKIKNKLEELFKEFENPLTIDIFEYKVNISAGIARYPNDGDNFHSLFKSATLALHESKKTRNKKYYFFNEQDNKKNLKKVIYTNSLANSIENNELQLAFQPQISTKTGKIIGAETLLRWNSKKFNQVPPNVFIPILENTGMIIKIGDWIIEQAVQQEAKMIEMGFDNIRISINLSPIQFQDETLPDKIQYILNKYNVDPKLIEFEITESVANSESPLLISAFKKIKSFHSSIALDDFGVKFSSLNRLQSLPIDRIKIDKSFIDGIGVDEKKEAIIKTILYLSKSLNLHSIAEGVETKEQVDFLKEVDCNEIQGFYYAKPMFADEFEEYVKNQRA